MNEQDNFFENTSATDDAAASAAAGTGEAATPAEVTAPAAPEVAAEPPAEAVAPSDTPAEAPVMEDAAPAEAPVMEDAAPAEAPTAPPAEEAPTADKKRKKDKKEKAPKKEKSAKREKKDKGAEGPKAPPHARKYRKKRQLRKHPIRGALRVCLLLLLGVLLSYGLIAGAVYYAIAGLTIDDLQRFGVAEGADEYLTDGGEKDLTAMSILDLIKDLDSVRADLASHSIDSLMARYGVVLPEDVRAKLPEDLLRVPLSEFSEGDPLATVTQNLKCGYILSYLPEGALDARMVEAISDRPLSLLTEGKYGELLEGVKLGYLTGVQFDEQGKVLYKDPAAPTTQECFALLDLGRLVGAVSNNEDIMAVLATDLGEQEVAPILGGLMSGALFEKMCEGHLVKDVLLADPETGRYTFSLTALTESVFLGDALGYTLVEGVWYTAYTDDGDDTNDTAASTMQATLADIGLADVIGGTLSLDATFDGLYLGDLQSGYVRGTAITAPDPAGGEPIVVGYTWQKGGEAVGKMETELANIMVNDLLTGTLDVTEVLGGLYIGDLQGYTYGADNRWYREVAGEDDPQYVGAVQNAISNISLEKALAGKLDIVEALGDLSLGDLQGYTYGSDNRWYREVAGEDDPQFVGAVQNAIANVGLSDVLEGGFSLSDALATLRMGDAMDYIRGAVTDPADPADPTTYDKYAFTKENGDPVTGAMLEIANLPMADVLEGRADLEDTVKGIPLGELLSYTKKGDTWYVTYVAENDPANKKATGILATLADKPVNELNAATVDAIYLGSILGYTEFFADDGDTVRDGWLDGSTRVSGMMLTVANLTVGQMSSGSTLQSELRGILLGDALGYTKVGDTWYSNYTDNGIDDDTPVLGVMKALADKKINEINEGTIDGIKLGDAIGYELKGGVWYDGETPAEGTVAGMADLTLGELKDQKIVVDKIGELKLATILDYRYDGNHWVHIHNGTTATGELSFLLGTQVKNIESTINTMPLGYAFGYYHEGEEWYLDSTKSGKPSGLTASLVDIPLSEAAGKLNTMPIGELLGYTKKGTVWYEIYDETDAAKNKLLSGIALAFANLSVTELGDAKALSDAMQTVMLGDALGYTKVGSTWYSSYTDNDIDDDTVATGLLGALADSKISGIESEIKALQIGTMLDLHKVGDTWYKADNTPATGVIAAIADSKASEIEATINATEVGVLLGFTKTAGGWQDAAKAPVTGLLATVAGTKVSALPDRMKSLTVADVFAADERTGVLAAIPATTPIKNIGNAVMNCTIEELVEAGVINEIDGSKDAMLQTMVGTGWKQMPLVTFMNTLLGGNE